ncbi:DUF4397 domain-containing protein [Ornithinimicrobium cryptoxanthini]|uniref:DUF4397 domain-containing protein n=1 Tax=Ornithinimicrobium cryptoxanthini TaxID=2934161 RepID=A0ABY4YDA3_9MICO|nr:DUF4397 domain-containing protein [Ornithinimicrobium cryptoxanthini]USQ74755.1 DUF4397 domain-containing protein [Ornithinimicrobium cryptoxanthini]
MRKTTTLALMTGVTAVAFAAPAAADGHESTVSVLHGVPGLTVDVYVNGEEAIPDFEPGTLTDPMMMAAGSYDIDIYADGDTPDTAEPALSASGLEVPGGANLTLAAHLGEDGTPMLSAFVNDVSQTAAGEARLTVRHAAAAPAVDVRAGGTPVIEGLTNPNEEVLDLPAGTVSADVVLGGTEDVVLGPADLNLAEGTNTIVYAWGSAADANLDLAVQTIDGLHSAPEGVPSGQGGLADNGALMVLALAGVAGAVVAGRSIVRSERV